MLTRLFPALFLLLAVSLAGAQEARNLQVGGGVEKRVALVIGNGDYKQGPLKNPVNDARAMRNRLESLGFEVLLKENLRKDDIGGVYREFRNKITPGGVALVFYAGHGVQFKGQNYFPAIDSDINFEEDVPLQSLNLGNLLDNMDEAKAGVSLVFLDACRDNPFARKFRSASRGLAKVEAASGTLIHYATKPGSVAADGEGLNGTYTEALLAQMGEAGVPVEQMLKKVTHRVTQRTSGKQEPWVEGSLRGEFYFIFQGPATVNVQQAPADADSSAWTAADTIGTLPAYEAYLKEYPKGRHAAAARIKIGALKAAATPGRPTAVPPVSTITPQASSDPDTAFWNEVKQSGSKDYLDAYLKQYPKGKFAALAKVELKKLEEREQQEKLQAEQDAWEQAKASHTPQAYDAYLQRYPQGNYAALARPARQKAQLDMEERALQESLRRKQQDEEREKQAEDALWQKAQAAKDSATVQGYLDRYPAGRYLDAAKERHATLKKEEEIRPGKVFKDCPECPEMVVIPAGNFQMGSNNDDADEKPVHNVSIAQPFALAKTHITRGQYAAFVRASGHNAGNSCKGWTGAEWEDTAGRNWQNPGFAQQDNHPVVCINWDDAQAYVRWLSQQTGKRYRLPSEAELEYAIRGGTTTSRWWGDSPDQACGNANVGDQTTKNQIPGWKFSHNCNDGHAYTAPAGTYKPNGFGLYDMIGNAYQWTEDCWNGNYNGAPTDGSAWTGGNCSRRVLRGGTWHYGPGFSRSAFRDRITTSERSSSFGFRPARMLP